MLFAFAQVFGQTATSDCSSLTVTYVPFPPSNVFGLNIVIPNGLKNGLTGSGGFFCNSAKGTKGLFLARRFFLEKKTNGVWSQVSTTSQYSATFPNLPLGTYRVLIEYPRADLSACDGAPVPTEVFDLLTGNLFGLLGTYSGGATSNFLVRTNEVVVGAPTQSDVQWSFLNGNGSQILPNLFDPNEPIKIDASACKNFDIYGIAIQEFLPNGSLGNWRALNNVSWWLNNATTPLGVVDLRALWDPLYSTQFADPNWQFFSGNTYRVQVALSNSNCTSWAELMQTFYVCPSSWNCRAGNEQVKIDPAIAPNPTSQKFRLQGFNWDASSDKDELVITDIAGRSIKTFRDVRDNEFDVSDLTTGIYFVTVLRSNRKLFTKKLMVNH